MLSGQVIVHEGGVATTLNPGEAVCFKAGVPVGHYLGNASDADATYLVVGARKAKDVITYPDHDRIYYADGAGAEDRFTMIDGVEDVGSAYRLPGA